MHTFINRSIYVLFLVFMSLSYSSYANSASPTISIIQNQFGDVSEVITVNFTVDDADTDVYSLTLSATSSNQVILRDDKFIFGGSGMARDVRLKPAPGLSGTTTIIITVFDGQHESSQSFDYDVGAPTTTLAPTISTIDDQFTDVSVVKIVDFTVYDMDTDVNTLELSGSSDNQTLLPDNEVILGGTDSGRNVRLRPIFAQSGIATVVITASDGQNESSESFVFEVGTNNTQPTIDDISNQTTEEDTPKVFAFNISDIETADAELELSVTTDNSDLLPVGNISFENNGSSRTVTLAPIVNQVGFAVVEITVTDSDNLQRTDGFILEVTRVNDKPTIDPIPPQIIDEDGINVVVIAVDDVDNTNGLLTVTAASNDQILLPNTNIIVEGATSDRSITLTPAPGKSGTATITVTVDDGEDEQFTVFAVTVTAENDVPIIENLNDQYIAQGTTSEFTFQVKDEEMSDDELDVHASSNNIGILSNENITIQTSGTNRTITLSPAAKRAGTVTVTVTAADDEYTTSDSFKLVIERVDIAPEIEQIDSVTMQLNSTEVVLVSVSDADNANDLLTVNATSSDQLLLLDSSIIIAGGGSSRTLTITPLPEQAGQVAVTATVTDPQGGQSEESFLITVNENSAPSIDDIGPQVTNEDLAKAVTFQVGDLETSDSELDVVWVSNNNTLLPNNKITMSENGASRTLTMTPVGNEYGTSTITVTVTDGDKEQFDEFLLTVTAENDAPTITDIPFQIMAEDADKTIDFTVGDVETAAGSLIVVPFSSDNLDLLPLSNITLAGSGANRTVKVDPVANQFGTATIRLTVDDGEDKDYDDFTMTVTSENDIPTITDIPLQIVAEDADKTINFTVGDVETAAGSLIVVPFSSSNPSLLPLSNIVLAGSGANRTVKLDPVANQFGTTTIRLTVDDGEDTQFDDFTVTVTAVNDDPEIDEIDDIEMPQGSSKDVTINVFDLETGATDLDLLVTSDNDELLGASHLQVSDSGGNRTLTITPPESTFGEANVSVTVVDEEGKEATIQFAVNVTSVTPAWAKTGGMVSDKALLDIDIPASNFTGAMAGSAGVSGGSASYSIPIKLPPGRSGMQPSVSINYGSRGGNGLAGVGFNLSAGGAISRCPATVAQDGFNSGIQFDKSIDKLCLNGQRLIAVDGTYGATNTEYRTEIDSFAKITQKSADLNSVSAYFEVLHASGSREFYGQSSSERVSPTNTTQTLTWLLNRVEDVSGNNHMTYTYHDIGDGEVLLDSIYYTGDGTIEGNRSVQFEYETRAKFSTSYLAGAYTRQTQRLKKVTTYYDANNSFNATEDRVRDYTLIYQSSSASGRSLLTSVEECGYLGTGLCHEPVIFDWQDDDTQYGLEILDTSGGEELIPIDTYILDIQKSVPHGDFDGNGSRDWPDYFVNAQGDNVGQNAFTGSTCGYSHITRELSCIDPDFNLDGLTDSWKIENEKLVIGYTTEGLGQDWNTAGETNVDVITAGNRDDQVVNVADYNGDGWPDVVAYEATFNTANSSLAGDLYLYLHSQNMATPYSTKTNLFAVQSNESVQYVGDMNGDGLADFVITSQGRLESRPVLRSLLLTHISSAGAVSFVEQDLALTNSSSIHTFSMLLDVNADGFADLIGWLDGSGVDLELRLNQGDGTFAPSQALGINLLELDISLIGDDPLESDFVAIPKFIDAFKQMDINGDGRTELILPSYDDADILVAACQTFPEYNGGTSWSQITRCGADIYDTYNINVGNIPTPTNPPSKWDRNIYRYQAIEFVEDQDGNISAQWVTPANTQLIADANNSMVIDAFGKGLQDLVFTYGCISGCTIDTVDAAGEMAGKALNKAYFNRNYGANTQASPGDEDYRATDLLASVNNGDGVVSQWRYRPLSSSDAINNFYDADRELGSDDEHFLFASSMYVVSHFEQSNGLENGTDGGLRNQTEYQYVAAMYNTQGRGFRGFKRIIETDVSRGTRMETDFRQIFPYSSLVESQAIYKANEAEAYSTTTNDWRENTTHTIAATFNVFNALSTSTQYDLNTKAWMSESTTTVAQGDVDEYGNVQATTSVIEDQFGTYTTTNTAVYAPQESANIWWPHKLTSSTVSKAVAYEAGVPDSHAGTTTSKTVSTKIDVWDSTHRKPQTITVAPGSSALSASSCNALPSNQSPLNACVTTLSTYNNFGLPTLIAVTGAVINSINDTPSLETRSTTTTYTDNGSSAANDGYFPFTISQNTGSKDLSTKLHTQPANGQAMQLTNLTGVVTNTQYDSLDRTVESISAGYPAQYTRYLRPDSNAPADAIMMVAQFQDGVPNSAAYLDKLGRTLRARTLQFNGNNAYADTEYDELGRTTAQSNVHSGNPVFSTYSGFDILGRPTTKVTPATDSSNENVITTYIYLGLTTNITTSAPDGANLDIKRSYNTLGQLMSTTDDKDGVTQYVYDSAGNPIVVQDAANNSIYAQYNDMGHKLWVLDPNQGQTNFTYNDFAELEKEFDANDDTIRYERDKLGRVTSRIDPDGTADFKWDTLKNGLLSWEAAPGIVKTYAYDASARPTTVITEIDGIPYPVTTEYDGNYGRPKSLAYPNGIIVALEYNNYGYLSHEKNAASEYVYREITAQDVWGNMTGSTLSHGEATGTYSYSGRTGQMLSSVVTHNGNAVHDLNYENYDSYGNIKIQRNLVTDINAMENFTYDSLHRLTQSSLNAGNTVVDINYAYDAVGNLTKKSDYSTNVIGAYQYVNGTNKLNSVSLKAGGTATFAYDDRGNLTHRNGALESIYNAFNKPVSINKNGSDIKLDYGADLARYKQERIVNGETITTHYIGKFYEVESKNGLTSTSTYISDAAIIRQSDTDTRIRFTHRDRLGSASTFTDHNGKVTAYRSYDPFGAPKGGDWSLLGIPQLTENPLDSDVVTRRGFTDHEHLDEAELIHMNGRVYDYNVGRFMSVDPFIVDPGNSQAINPYSYVMNNPLGYTDPSGYTTEKAEVKGEVKTEKVATTGSRIKSKTKTTVSGTVTKEDGTSKSFSFSQVDNGKVTGSVSHSWSKSSADIGSQERVAGGGDFSEAGNDLSGDNNEFVKLNGTETASLIISPASKTKPESTVETSTSEEEIIVFRTVTTLTDVIHLDAVTFNGEDIIKLEPRSPTLGHEPFVVMVGAYPIDDNGDFMPVVGPPNVQHVYKIGLSSGFNTGARATIDAANLNWDTSLFTRFRWKVSIPTQQQRHGNSSGKSVKVLRKVTVK